MTLYRAIGGDCLSDGLVSSFRVRWHVDDHNTVGCANRLFQTSSVGFRKCIKLLFNALSAQDVLKKTPVLV